MQLLEILAVCFLFIDATNSLEEIVKKQFTGRNDRWKNDENIVNPQHQSSGSAAIVTSLVNNIMQILDRNLSNLSSVSQYKRKPIEKMNWNLKRLIGSLNGKNDLSQKIQSSAHLDTGGNNFDRFIVSERGYDNPTLDWIIGKFSKRGLDWSNGNLRLVNVQGNSIFGSDLIVHDRSIEIPLKRWIYILNSMLKLKPNYI
ncbi:Antimicrobial peptide X precursor [Dirofilaria immitis]